MGLTSEKKENKKEVIDIWSQPVPADQEARDARLLINLHCTAVSVSFCQLEQMTWQDVLYKR